MIERKPQFGQYFKQGTVRILAGGRDKTCSTHMDFILLDTDPALIKSLFS